MPILLKGTLMFGSGITVNVVGLAGGDRWQVEIPGMEAASEPVLCVMGSRFLMQSCRLLDSFLVPVKDCLVHIHSACL